MDKKMASIKRISFAHTGKNEGCKCDKCGQWITNIWTVEWTDGLIQNYGIDCFDKLSKTGNLTKQDKAKFEKLLKKQEHYTEELELWKNLTEQEAEERGLIECLKPGDPEKPWNDSYWNGKTFEEYKDWMLSVWFPARLRGCEEELKVFSRVRFER